jgi:acyl-CoA thioester hydrolase
MTHVWHKHVVRVHYKETDQMGVVHHANYISWFEIGRTEWMRANGIAYCKIESLGLMLPVIDLGVKYRKSAHYDDCIAIYTKIASLSVARLEFEYEVRKIGNEQSTLSAGEGGSNIPEGKLLASGTTLHMWINQNWKPVRIDKAAPEVWTLLQSNFQE